ncbi:MAG: hypothetical protein M0D54_17290 [Hyphomonadaceae bacterium JAD_PAG50586_4]|nr:MAG: hypothetical protein M0D54_17290 [Hyphomonadaceae bacterium JAD_PAG50586_4]
MLDDPELFAVYGAITASAHEVVARHIVHMRQEVAEILNDGARDGAWRVKDGEKTAELILGATTRFHHPAMVQFDGGKSDLRDLDALVDVLIAGLAAE